MAKAAGIDIGTVTLIEEIHVGNLVPKQLTGVIGSYPQDMVASTKSWRIVGYLASPTQTDIEKIKSIESTRNVILLEITEVTPEFLAFGKIRSVRWIREEENVDIHEYEILFEEVPAATLTTMQTDNAYIQDLLQMESFTTIYPLWFQNNTVFNSARTQIDWEIHMVNKSGVTQDLIVEVQAHGYMTGFQLYYWDGTAYQLIGDWGGADAWGATKTFTDTNNVIHDVTLNKGIRGATITGIGTISRSIGTRTRVLFKITNMQNNITMQFKLVLKLSTAISYYKRNAYIDGSVEH